MFHLTIVTAETTTYDGDVQSIVAPAVDGEIGILTNHHPLVTKLGPGALRVTKADGSEEYLFANGGYLEVNNNKAIILSDVVENIEAIQLEEVKNAKQRALELLKHAKDDVEREALEEEIRMQTIKERLADIAEYKKRR